ncbi:unnamed protein product [Diabrotica balteata]|uniref:BESS domain-containing protein n=1 Tax=Diabrotica balteata TaxID=107213 RepID=A0A9N9XFB2_DIABA|nr:unnamed protein product [Diabrotica balteata]
MLKNYFEEKAASKVTRKADHLQKFFKALQETVRTFSPHLQIEIKSEISNLVSEYELKQLMINEITNNHPVHPQVPLVDSNITSSSVSYSPLLSPINRDKNTVARSIQYIFTNTNTYSTVSF